MREAREAARQAQHAARESRRQEEASQETGRVRTLDEAEQSHRDDAAEGLPENPEL